MEKKRTPDETLETLTALANELFLSPGRYERQDIVMDLAAVIYGEGNPLITYPIRRASEISPSTPQACALLAYLEGHDPIYFAGYDMCQWQNKRRAKAYFHDGSSQEYLNPSDGVGAIRGESGFWVDSVQLGEKNILMSYLGKRYRDKPVLPGFRCVEIVCEGVRGNLELLPRIGLEEFVAGGTRDFDEKQQAAKISEVMSKRGSGASV